MKSKEEIRKIIYSESGRAINARFNPTWMNANGLSDEVSLILNETEIISELKFTERVSAWLSDVVYRNQCGTCGTEVIKWSKGSWAKYCSMKCCQNDPIVKDKMKDGQKGVDWDSVIEKRQTTMMDSYGVSSISQLPENREAMSIRSSELWKDQEKVDSAKLARADTNLEKYGVDHLSKDSAYHSIRVDKAKETRNNKSTEEKKIIFDKISRIKLGDYAMDILEDADTLRNLYETDRMSINSIRKHLGCHWEVVFNALKRAGVNYDATREYFISSVENELYNLIKQIYPSAVQSYRDGKELDVFIPELNLGFEMNGCYWHSDEKKDKFYHSDKVDYFSKKGIRVIQIWEDTWERDYDRVSKFIKNLLNENKNRIGARKCEVCELSQSQYDLFMEDNHLQGGVATKYRFGLLYENKIVSAIGFKEIAGNVRRISNGYGIELNRFANTSVSGGFSKLLKYAVNHIECDFVVSFGDRETISDISNVYLSNGFSEEYRINPDYKYYNYRIKRREHKFGYRKKKFKRLGYDIEGKTERDLAKEHKLLRCYDSGKILYIKRFS